MHNSLISSLTESNCRITIRALEIGAIDFVTKPKTISAETMENISKEIIDKIKNAAKANIKMAETVEVKKMIEVKTSLEIPKKYDASVIIATLKKKKEITEGERIVVMGASTGGTVAIQQILNMLSKDSPPMAIVQHIPEGFSLAYANRVNSEC